MECCVDTQYGVVMGKQHLIKLLHNMGLREEASEQNKEPGGQLLDESL
jgi:hypothetical protein